MKTATQTYIKPADSEMFRHGKAHLLHLAAGRGKQAEAAQFELKRRSDNKAAKKQGGRA